jgi:hypothetical protein
MGVGESFMRPSLSRWVPAAAAIATLSVAVTVESASNIPVISARTYVGGSAKITVTGSFQINDDIAIDKEASLSDGEMTWLQYGASGLEAPNALVTVSTTEFGLHVARGKQTATAGAEDCSGDLVVSGNSITGQYKCQNVTSYDARTDQMGKVNIEISLTATS